MLQDNPGVDRSWPTQVRTVSGVLKILFCWLKTPLVHGSIAFNPLHLHQRCVVTDEVSTNPLAGVMRVDWFQTDVMLPPNHAGASNNYINDQRSSLTEAREWKGTNWTI